ncbi:AN1-type zinc finger protein 6 [Drosophila subpulchrella]|uniref:AN1-type zinc finger protein 6 n=1 Tax=Drosophila subpulchrella TaxID=1486046 RepID=UPI0018A15391|nr:AN1-type zinc finger protein 6 [Drosophila subpulchrella]
MKTGKLRDSGEPKPDIILGHSEAGLGSEVNGQPLATATGSGSQLPMDPDHREPQHPQPVRALGGQNSQSANSSDAGQSQNPGQNQDAGAGSGSGQDQVQNNNNKNQNQQQQQQSQNDQDNNQEQDAPKKRCDKCGKKLGLTGGFPCRCGGTYCAVHRYSDRHECSFDYREMGATEIRRDNPVVVASKLRKL